MTSSPGRPRDPSVDERISRAALDLLREHGPQSVHIDAVATRSGVARSTIYRRFPDRESLITSTFQLFTDAPFPAIELPVEDKLPRVLESVRQIIEEDFGPGAIAAVFTEADPVFSAALRGRLTRWLEELQVQVEADIASGRVQRGTDAESLAHLAFGACLAEVLQYGRARPGWADRVINLLLRGLTGPGEAG